MESVKASAELANKKMTKLCALVEKTQENLLTIIQHVAVREQSSDLKSFLRRESVIPGGDEGDLSDGEDKLRVDVEEEKAGGRPD